MKVNTKNFINLRLYLDAMKQLRLVGLISLGILLLISVLTPIGKAIEMTQTNYANFPFMITTTRACYGMYLIFTIITPVLTLLLFSFLTKRNSSDYFHSFPISRGCLYNTYMAAVISWIGIITVGSAVVTGITYSFLSQYFVFSYWNLARYSASILICALLVAAAISIACAITGTLFTNIVATGLILFLPRLILAIIVNMVTSNLNILVSSKILPLLDYNYNLIFNSLGKVFNSQNSNIFQVSAVIYTLVLAIIYIVVGRLLFIKRKSETAANPSANKYLQVLIRLGISIPVCMIPISTIFVVIIKKANLHATDIFWIVVLYLIAIALMLLYELISTKKFKNVVKATPSIALLAVANVFILLILVGVYESQLNYKPQPSQIKYVTVSNNIYNEEPDYFEKQMSSKKIKNQDLIQLLSENLAKNIEYEKTSYPNMRYSAKGSINNVHAVDAMNIGSDFVIVGFQTGLTVKYRNLYLDSSTYEKYIQLLLASQDIKDFYLNLPQYDKNLMSFSDGLNAKQNEDIYNTLRSELKDVDYSKWYSALYNKSNAINIDWNYNVDDTTIKTRLPLTKNTPHALQKYLNYVNETETAAKALQDVKAAIEADNQSYNIDVSGLKEDFTGLDGDYAITYRSSQSNVKTQALEVCNAVDIDSLTDMASLSDNDQIPVKMSIRIMDVGSKSSSDGQYYSFYALMKKDVFNELKGNK